MTVAISWTPDRIAAIVLGGFAILFIVWYFFGARRRPGTRASSSAGAAGDSIRIEVAGGYDPDTIVARKGVPLTLVFDRRESNPCTDQIVIPEFGIRQSLLAHGTTAVKIVPQKAGEFEFSCGMNMLHGRIRVTDD